MEIYVEHVLSSNAMKKLQYILLMILALLYMERASAAPAKTNSGSISSFIEANRRNREIVLNTAKYDQNAKVFYIYNLSYYGYNLSTFKEHTDFLTEAQRIIFHKGADIVVLLDVDESRKESRAQARSSYYGFDVYKAVKRCALKSPILNCDSKKVRSEFHKKSGSIYISTYRTLYAVDANGIPLASFDYDDQAIEMTTASTREPKIIAEGRFDDNQWIVEAILQSYKELVAQATPQQEESAAANESEKPSQKTAKAKKKAKMNRMPKWQKVESEEADTAPEE